LDGTGVGREEGAYVERKGMLISFTVFKDPSFSSKEDSASIQKVNSPRRSLSLEALFTLLRLQVIEAEKSSASFG